MTRQRFKGQSVIVTGAAQGIGRGVALAMAAEGAQLVLADRSALIHEVAAEARALAARAGDHTTTVARTASARDEVASVVDVVVVTADLETYSGARAVAAAALESFGRIDVLVNNVGGTIWAKPYQEYEEDEIEAEIRRSLFPTLWCCRSVLPAMIAQQSGAIVNISSIATRSIHRIPYAAAKGGVNALTASLAFEHAADGIRVNAVATGGTEAPPRKVPRNPKPLSEQEKVWYQGIVDQTLASSLMHRYGTIDEQVGAILFLASPEAAYITGTVLPVGGGDQG